MIGLLLGVRVMVTGRVVVALNGVVCSSHDVVNSSLVVFCQDHDCPMKKGHEAKDHG